MKQVYKCDFCEETFSNEIEAKIHEEHCGYNPKNKIYNSLIFRLSMIYGTLPSIIACALYEVANGELDYLYSEAERAGTANCFYAIYESKGKLLLAINKAKSVADEHKGRNSSTYKDIMKEYPEIFEAIVKTLRRKAWNEREGEG